MSDVVANSFTINSAYNGYGPFYHKTTMNNVDLNYVPWTNNTMYNAFSYCTQIDTVSNINEDVTNLSNAFSYCYRMANCPTIPSSVVDMSYAFRRCNRALVNAPDMSLANNVTNMQGAFYDCWQLKNPPIIPNSVKDLSHCFVQCNSSSFVTAPTIPYGVENMSCTFYECWYLQNFQEEMPNSLTSMAWTFKGCTSLTTAPIIPDSVVYMNGIFSACSSLTGNIIIKSPNVIEAASSFSGSLQKNVYIPFSYANGEHTATYNSFISAGYDESGSRYGVYLKDLGDL